MDFTIGCDDVRCIIPITVSGLHPLVYLAKTKRWDVFRITLPKTGCRCTEKKETKTESKAVANDETPLAAEIAKKQAPKTSEITPSATAIAVLLCEI